MKEIITIEQGSGDKTGRVIFRLRYIKQVIVVLNKRMFFERKIFNELRIKNIAVPKGEGVVFKDIYCRKIQFLLIKRKTQSQIHSGSIILPLNYSLTLNSLYLCKRLNHFFFSNTVTVFVTYQRICCNKKQNSKQKPDKIAKFFCISHILQINKVKGATLFNYKYTKTKTHHCNKNAQKNFYE